jgi:hypothetical protein
MNKKQLTALLNSIVLSIVATANADADGEEPLTEEEARTLLGMRLKRVAKKLVAESAHVDADDVIWVDWTKEKTKADDSDAVADEDDDSDDAIAA